MNPQLTIQIVGWNSAATLPRVITGLKAIPRDQVILRYIDNGSTDSSVQLIREALPQADIIELKENRGYAGAHNIGFARCTTPFVLTHDPDVTITWGALQELLTGFSDHKIGALQGTLLRADSNRIDSAGIELTLALNGKERGANEPDSNQYDSPASLVAVTGACGLYRMAALREVAHSDAEIFDNDFFAYKEDVDVGWRLTRAGWKVMYHPIVIGHHARTMGKRGVGGWGLSVRNIRERMGSQRTYYSFRNWVWMITKNASPLKIFLHSPFILARVFIFLGLSLTYPKFFAVWPDILTGILRMKRKRNKI